MHRPVPSRSSFSESGSEGAALRAVCRTGSGPYMQRFTSEPAAPTNCRQRASLPACCLIRAHCRSIKFIYCAAHESESHVAGFSESIFGNELVAAMKILTAREKVRAGKTAPGQL